MFIYVFSSFVHSLFIRVVCYQILGDLFILLDHHPISLQINLSNCSLRGSSWKVNAWYLQEAWSHVRKHLEGTVANTPFFTKLWKIVCFYKNICIVNIIAFRLEEKFSANILRLDKLLFHLDPQNEKQYKKLKHCVLFSKRWLPGKWLVIILGPKL